MKRKINIAFVAAAALLIPLGASGTVNAAAQPFPISGTKYCGSGNGWLTSSNIRSVSSGSSSIKVKMADAGTGGIKMRAKFVNDNTLTNTGFYPPLNSYQTLTSTTSAGKQFQFQFACVTAGDQSSVFTGTASY